MDEDLKLEAAAAAQALKEGGIILYPTDTVWGLGCDATDSEAVERIFQIKNRPDSKSLIVLVSDADMLCRYVKQVPPMAMDLIDINDKPMTIIYPQGIGLAPNLLAEDGSIAIRIPMHEFCREMIRKFGRPVVSTSANISGDPSPICYEDINAQILTEVDYTVDPYFEDGATGKPSQIIKIGMDGTVKIIRE